MFKTRVVGVIKCEFCAEGSSEGSLIVEIFSKFVWTSIFWVFTLSRVNSVYGFPKPSPHLGVKSFKNTWRIDFFSFSSSVLVKTERHLVEKCSLSNSSRKQKRRKCLLTIH